MHLKEGTLLQGGKYRIVRFISSGGFGCTYEAEHVMFRKRVAIKEFFVKDFCGRDENTALVTVETTKKRGLIDKMKLKFIDEARSLFDLHHQGIVRVTDIFEENHTAYYVMDYIDGKSLKEIVDKEGALSEVRALGYIRQVADALGYVHAHNRLHLDIKPGNIMIDGNDHAILIDFGTSKQYDEVNGENTSTLLGHTPGYAPPEQIGNDLVKFTPTTDIYALGATLYKLLSGITPTSSNLRISGEKMEPLSGSISAPTCNTVERAMKLNRYNRPDSIDAFLSLLFAPADDEEETVHEDVSLVLSVSQLKPKLPKWLIPIAFCSLTALCILGLRKCPGHNGGGSEDYDSLCSLVHVDSISVVPPVIGDSVEPTKVHSMTEDTVSLIKPRKMSGIGSELSIMTLRNEPILSAATTTFKDGDDFYLYMKSMRDIFVAVFMEDKGKFLQLLPYKVGNNPYKLIKDTGTVFFDTYPHEKIMTCEGQSVVNKMYVVSSNVSFQLVDVKNPNDEDGLPYLNRTDFNKLINKSGLKTEIIEILTTK